MVQHIPQSEVNKNGYTNYKNDRYNFDEDIKHYRSPTSSSFSDPPHRSSARTAIVSLCRNDVYRVFKCHPITSFTSAVLNVGTQYFS